MPCHQADDSLPGEVTGPHTLYFAEPAPRLGEIGEAYFFAQGEVSDIPVSNPITFVAQATLKAGATLSGTSFPGLGRKVGGGQVLFLAPVEGTDLQGITPCRLSPWA